VIEVIKIGQIVPSSNVTMEREIPTLFRARETILPERFSFHASRMRMKTVTKDELAAMDAASDRCALELSDAKVDILGYACLVAIMAMGNGYHRQSESRLRQRTAENGAVVPVVTSAGALIAGLQHLGAKRIALIAPYMKPLTRLVVDYIESEGIEVKDYLALEIPDNLQVGEHDPLALVELHQRLNVEGVDAIVLSACVQMPSLAAIATVESKVGVPVVSAATCTAWQMMKKLGLEPRVPQAGALLAGGFA
jgi:maleate isomerase